MRATIAATIAVTILGIEGVVRVLRMGDAGTTSVMTFGIIGGWL